MKRVSILLLAVFLITGLAGCRGERQRSAEKPRMKVVTTLFPLFDFAGKVGREKVEVTLLLPPGVEPHDFEPKPKDLATIQEADVFVYTGSTMEPWVQKILKAIDTRNLVVIDASREVNLRSVENDDHDGEGHAHRDHLSGRHSDPHIWLDFANAQLMVKNIAQGFSKKHPEDSDFYTRNALIYNNQLQRLDDEYRAGLGECKTRFFLHGGHFAFNYLARRYNLTYISVHGVSPNSEPSPAHVIDMINKMKRYHVSHIFTEELSSPRVAETIAKETGAELRPLSPAHNVTKEQMEQHITFIDIMKTNLAMLQEGLLCR